MQRMDCTVLRQMPSLGFAVLITTIMILGCNKKSTNSPDDNLPATSQGVLLSGNPDSLAVAATIEIPLVTPDPYQALDTNGFLANRLFVVLNPTSQIGPVNAILDSLGAKIISMSSLSLFLTLSMPAMADTAQVTVLCSRLRESGLFLFAFPAYSAVSPPDEPETPAEYAFEIPGTPASDNMAHLKSCLMPAAWNAKDYANRQGFRVSVLVPDAYVQLQPSPEIPAQVIVPYAGDGADIRVLNGASLGNHGFHVCGIIGAKYDDFGATGIHPGPANILEIRSLNAGGEEWGRKLQLIKDAIPLAGLSVVNTSMGYNDPFFQKVDKWQRVLLALKWRELVGEVQTKFLLAASAGNDARRTGGAGSLAVFNSPFTMAALMNSPWEWLGQGEYTGADSLAYVSLENHYRSAKPWVVSPLSNVITVGSSAKSGARSAFSNWGADVRMMGEGIFGPCMQNDVDCFDNFALLTGTSQAAPQIAGLAAYLINLRPKIDMPTLKSTIVSAYDNSVGFVDAYRAVLSLDNGLTSALIRKTILDVDSGDNSGGGEPVFDEKDIEIYLGLFNPPTGIKDFSPCDLNGDGYTGGPRTAPFDLTADNPPSFTNVTLTQCGNNVTLDEHALTDLAILKYCAYSSLYTGNLQVRDSLLACESPGEVHLLSETAYTWSNTGRTPLLPNVQLTDSVMFRREPVSTSFFAESQDSSCNGYYLHSTSEQKVTYTLGSSNTAFTHIAGFLTGTLEGTQILPDDCSILTTAVSMHMDSIEVRNQPIGYDLSILRDAPNKMNASFTLTNNSSLRVQDTSATGVLTPGIYVIYTIVGGSITSGTSTATPGTSRIDFSLTFHPAR